MDLKDILSISGYPDLFKLVAQARNGIIVESLQTNKRMQAFASSRISTLEDITVFTDEGEIQLKAVLILMYRKSEGRTVFNQNPSSEEAREASLEHR